PQRGILLRRAHELLEQLGQPASEELLIQHLFGVGEHINGSMRLWTTLLCQILESSSLFERVAMPGDLTGLENPGAMSKLYWALTSWRSTQQALDDVEFIVVDTETTGLRPGPDRVIEIAALRLRGGKVIETFQSLVNPGRRIPPFIVKFTGITQDMVAGAPTAQEIFPDFLRFIEDTTIVGHNVGF